MDNKKPQEQWIVRRFEHSEKKRYYQIFLQRGLLGWEVFRCWGGINQATGNKMVMPCDSYQEAVSKLALVVDQRAKKNYKEVRCDR